MRGGRKTIDKVQTGYGRRAEGKLTRCLSDSTYMRRKIESILVEHSVATGSVSGLGVSLPFRLAASRDLGNSCEAYAGRGR